METEAREYLKKIINALDEVLDSSPSDWTRAVATLNGPAAVRRLSNQMAVAIGTIQGNQKYLLWFVSNQRKFNKGLRFWKQSIISKEENAVLDKAFRICAHSCAAAVVELDEIYSQYSFSGAPESLAGTLQDINISYFRLRTELGRLLSPESAPYTDTIYSHSNWACDGDDYGRQADFSHKDLSGIDLSYETLIQRYRGNYSISLNHIIFTGAELTGANFDEASLRNADFTSANLSDASLRHSALIGVHFNEVNLSGADLSYADLSGADFTGAIVESTNLRCAILAESIGLTLEQIQSAYINDSTQLPDYLLSASL